MANLDLCLWVDGLGQRYGQRPWDLVNGDPLALVFDREVARRCVEHEEKERGEARDRPSTREEKRRELDAALKKHPGLDALLERAAAR